MKYDYYIKNGKELKKFNSKVEALENAQGNIPKKGDLAMVRRVKQEDEIIIPSLKEFFKKNIPFKTPTISPLILKMREVDRAEEKKDNHKGVVVKKVKKVKKDKVRILKSA